MSHFSKEILLKTAGVEIKNKNNNKHKNILIIGVYRPPCYSNIVFCNMYNLLSKYVLNKNNYSLIVGDN